MSEQQPDYVGHRERLRDRFKRVGANGLAEHEIVELLLTLSIPRGDTKPHAKRLLNRFGSLRGILDAPMSELTRLEGVGQVTAANLHVIKAAASLYLEQGARGADKLSRMSDLVDMWRVKIGGLPHEVFEVAYLHSGMRIPANAIVRIEDGTVDRASVYPREVVAEALRRKAAGVVLAHNHPNGDTHPSDHDKVITLAIQHAADTIGLKVLDHIIVSAGNAFSFKEAGLL